ncbi:MAG: hypothetical protein U0V73_14595 [Acidimicrobiia bacterium]
MTDDRTSSTDAEARIRALQERRARAADRRGTPADRRPRGHAAEGSRVFVAGLSVASFLTIGAAITVAQQRAASLAAGQPAVTVQAAGPPTAGQPAAKVAPAAPVPAQPAPKPVTVSKGS